MYYEYSCKCVSYFITDGQDFITLSTQTEYTVHLGENVSLICGFNLTSSDAAIIWRFPNGSILYLRIKPDDHKDYNADLDTDRLDVVRLNLFGIDASDDGVWNCTIEVPEAQYTVALEIHLNVVCKLKLHKAILTI